MVGVLRTQSQARISSVCIIDDYNFDTRNQRTLDLQTP